MIRRYAPRSEHFSNEIGADGLAHAVNGPTRSLFDSRRDHRIDFRCSAHGNVTCKQRDANE
jgi:hypothetical protein